MVTSAQSQPLQTPPNPAWKLLTGGKPERHEALGKQVVWTLIATAVFRLAVALLASHGIVDDATFGLLRQGGHPWTNGNGILGGSAGPTTQPLTLFGLVATGLHAWFASLTPWVLLGLGVFVWTLAVGALLRPQRPSIRPALALLLGLGPAFVDGALRGSAAEWVGFLLAKSLAGVASGRTTRSILWWMAAVLTAPVSTFFAPVWLGVHLGRMGFGYGLRTLFRWQHAVALALPILAWSAWAPVGEGQGPWDAWLGWALGLHSPWHSAGELWLGLPAFSGWPWMARSSMLLRYLAAAVLAVVLGVILRTNWREGTAGSWGWLVCYLLLVSFGAGALTSSAIIPALALTMALVPVLLTWVPRFHGRGLFRASAVGLVGLALPVAWNQPADLAGRADAFPEIAAYLSALDPQPQGPVLTAHAGHLGFLYSGLVASWQPPLDAPKTPACSGTSLAQASDATWILVSEENLAHNQLPGVGRIWSSEADHGWWNQMCVREATLGAWHLYRIQRSAARTHPTRRAPSTNGPG